MPRSANHLDEVTGAELECQVPPHAQDNYLLVEMPTPEEFLCGGRFCHPSRYRRKPSLSSLHQNLFLNFLGIRMDSRKAEGMRFTINLITPDNGEEFLVELENATLTNIKGSLPAIPT